MISMMMECTGGRWVGFYTNVCLQPICRNTTSSGETGVEIKVIANNDLDISPQNAPLNGLILVQLALCLIMSSAPMERSAVVANVTQG